MLRGFHASSTQKGKNEGVLHSPKCIDGLADAAAEDIKRSERMTEIGTMVTLSGTLGDVDLGNRIFLQLPYLGGTPVSEAPRVQLLHDQTQLTCDPIAEEKTVAQSPIPRFTASP